jgi:hypothetical protein
MTRELTSLKSNKAKASKKSKGSENWCLKDDAINNCECERLLEKYVLLRDICISGHTMITAQKSKRRSRAIRRPFLGM